MPSTKPDRWPRDPLERITLLRALQPGWNGTPSTPTAQAIDTAERTITALPGMPLFVCPFDTGVLVERVWRDHAETTLIGGREVTIAADGTMRLGGDICYGETEQYPDVTDVSYAVRWLAADTRTGRTPDPAFQYTHKLPSNHPTPVAIRGNFGSRSHPRTP